MTRCLPLFVRLNARRIGFALLAAVGMTLAGPISHGAEIGFIEDFSLSEKREEALKKLIPGTDDYYYYHALHAQNREDYDKVNETLGAWRKRYPNGSYPARYWELLDRNMLLTYHKDPQATLKHLRSRLNLHFNHQRERLNQKPNFPTTLDQKLISRERLAESAYSRHGGNSINGFDDSALDWLISTNLTPDTRRQLLSRLQRPDYKNLPKLVVDDLRYKYSRGFGQFAIHQLMLLSQLDECVKLYPALLNHSNYVNTYITKLRPNNDTDWRNDPKEYSAYLDRLWAFAQRLAPAHNSLKGHILYHRLVFDRTQGSYDRDTFSQYIKLPKYVSYVNDKWMRQELNRKYPCNLNANYQAFTLLPVVGNDEPVIRDYLLHFFKEDAGYQGYEPFIRDTYLKRQFAEAKVTNGLGDAEQWYSMLDPTYYKQLKERVDLAFAYTNKEQFDVKEPVNVDVFVKNAPTLLVKVYEVNTANFYRENLRELDTDINLDGLVANKETTFTYKDDPIRRIARNYTFPELNKRGVYVIDFIGNGKSSRVLVRKGKLSYLARTSTAGHVFTVMDEQKNHVKDAGLILGNHHYKADKDGLITVPYSNRPGRQPIVLMQGDFASYDTFTQSSENYQLAAAFHVDRESLLKRKNVDVLIRPSLSLNGVPVTLGILEDVKLVINSVDHDGVQSSKEVADFKLFEDRDSVYEFTVPDRLNQVSFILKAKTQNLSLNQKMNLVTSAAFSLNAIDRTDKVEDLHLSNINGSHVLELLGKTGEAKPDRPIKVQLRHRDFKDVLHLTMQTDRLGRVTLGALQDIEWIRLQGPEGTNKTWRPREDAHTYHSTVHGAAGDAVFIPFMGDAPNPQRADLSLLELRDNTFVKDQFNAISVVNGFVKIDDLPRGDYDLLLKRSNTRIRIRLTEGNERHRHVVGDHRQLEIRNATPLQISNVEHDKSIIKVKLANAGKFTRVHVYATRYVPTFHPFDSLSRVGDPEPLWMIVGKNKSLYIAGRNIGDEYRYILERKFAKVYPGNMLKRQGLLLNPWAIRTTVTGEQVAATGDFFGGKGGASNSDSRRGAGRSNNQGTPQDFANLDFLGLSSAAILNLTPNKDGEVIIERKLLKDRQHVHIIAVNPQNTAFRSIALPAQDTKFIDLRLANGLDSKKHYAEQKQISIVTPDRPFVINDITTSKFEAYDNLARVYAMYATLSGDPKLLEFGFILNWPKMSQKEKQTQYSKYASHELNFFLFKKDPAFFNKVVKPYLANKQDKTFMDHWLLGSTSREMLQPWDYEQLNTVERILLAQRIKGEQQYTARHVGDQFALIPPNLERYNFLFKTAVKGSDLDTGDSFGFETATKAAKPAEYFKANAKLAERQRWANDPNPYAATAGASPSAKPAPTTAPRRPGGPPASEKAPSKRDEAKSEGKDRADMDDALELEESLGKNMGRMAQKKLADKYYESDAKRRKEVRQYYRKLDKVKEWVENNYYKLPIQQQNASLVSTNSFWNDYARHNPEEAFYSTSLADASRNFTEMMLAMSVLDIPFEPKKHDSQFKDAQMTLKAGSAMVVFHQEIKPAKKVARQTPILVSQNFFRHNDRYRMVANQRTDKYVTDEFLVQTVYGAQVVITNPTSSHQKIDVLLQVPEGAIAVLNGQQTKGVHLQLPAYNTKSLEYYFYFPAAGNYDHYPVHVAKDEEVIAFAKPFTFKVVNELTNVDKESWAYISQWGTEQQVYDYLVANNMHDTQMVKIAWRMKDKAFFQRVTNLLTMRHAYDHTLFSYGILHNVVPPTREFLEHSNSFVSRCGDHLISPLLTIDPVARKSFEFMEYSPMVNARAHQLGKRRNIVNDRFAWQFNRFLKVLSYKNTLADEDNAGVAYYMTLQDRVDDAMDFFKRVNPNKLASRIQYDQMAAYLDFYSDDLKVAAGIVEMYKDHPVDRWRETFATIGQQLKEIQGGAVNVIDGEDRDQKQSQLAATEPTFAFNVEAKKININYQNLEEVRVNYYLMDVELLFSRNPFVQEFGSTFSYIKPNATQIVKLNKKGTQHSLALPKEYHQKNVLVELVGNGKSKNQPYYSNAMTVQVIQNYGQVRVTQAANARAIPKTYVKVYAMLDNGQVKFYKDGYTDLRGRFDFTSLNTNELDRVQKFSLLVLSDTHGAVVREAQPPKQ